MRPCDAAARAVRKRGRVPGDGQRSQQIGVQDQRCWTSSVGSALVQCPQGTDEEQVLLKSWFGFLNHQAVGGFQHDLAGRIRAIVVGERFTKGVQ
jgi:hypothetical protein